MWVFGIKKIFFFFVCGTSKSLSDFGNKKNYDGG
jgi:hypothetical protein